MERVKDCRSTSRSRSHQEQPGRREQSVRRERQVRPVPDSYLQEEEDSRAFPERDSSSRQERGWPAHPVPRERGWPAPLTARLRSAEEDSLAGSGREQRLQPR